MDNIGIYVIITKPVLSYVEIAEICVEEEIKYLQLREKHLTDKQLLSVGAQIQSITKGTKTKFIINDRADIAHILDADGYHLGQDDIPLPAVRKCFSTLETNNKMITGLSTHNLNQLRQAMKLRPDYVGFGPVYKTPTKAVPDPVVGTELLQQALKIANVPIIAIGGINGDNVNEVLAAGAINIAPVRYLMETEKMQKRLRLLKRIIQSNQE